MVDRDSRFDTAEEIVQAWGKRLVALVGVERVDVLDLIDQRQPLLPSTKQVLQHLLDGGDPDGAVAILKTYEAHVAYRAIKEELAWVLWNHIGTELRVMDRVAEAMGRSTEAVAEILEGRPAATKGVSSLSDDRSHKQLEQEDMIPADASTTRASKSGYFAVADLATKHGVNAEPLRKRLDRWRRDNPGGDFIENTERKGREPAFLYSEAAVLPVIEALKKASDIASGERPASRE